MNKKASLLLVGVVFWMGCSSGHVCLTSVECAPGRQCMRIAPYPEDTTNCMIPCGVGLEACAAGTTCFCPDSPDGSRCSHVGTPGKAFFCGAR